MDPHFSRPFEKLALRIGLLRGAAPMASSLVVTFVEAALETVPALISIQVFQLAHVVALHLER
jgi:hypothetical protein